MVSTEEIFSALERQVQRVLPGIIVTPNHLDTSERDYVWVRIRGRHTDEGQGLVVRRVAIDLQVVLNPAANLATLNSRLYEIADDFTRAFNGFLEIGNRAVTMYDADSRIFDGILTYSFNLEFADYVDRRRFNDYEEYDKMQELYIKENANVRTDRI